MRKVEFYKKGCQYLCLYDTVMIIKFILAHKNMNIYRVQHEMSVLAMHSFEL